jgi:hypothetical protein
VREIVPMDFLLNGSEQHNIAAGDQIGHLFTLASGKCATKGEVGGAASKEGVFSEHGEVSEDHSKVSGVYVETFDSGDKIFYTYQATGTMKDSAFQAGENKYQITGGTGKMKGIKGSGTYKTTRHRRWRVGVHLHRGIQNRGSCGDKVVRARKR